MKQAIMYGLGVYLVWIGVLTAIVFGMDGFDLKKMIRNPDQKYIVAEIFLTLGLSALIIDIAVLILYYAWKFC